MPNLTSNNHFNLGQQQQQSFQLQPQTVQSLQLLSMPIAELEDYLNKLIVENPFLERIYTEIELCDVNDFHPRHTMSDSYTSVDDYLKNCITASSPYDTLQEVLRLQILMRHLPPQEEAVCLALIEHIDSDGYFSEDPHYLCRYLHTSIIAVEHAIRVIQELEPRGIGARNLAECLILQIEDTFPQKAILTQILLNDFHSLAQNKSAELAQKYHVKRQVIESFISYIRTLDPKPGRIFSREEHPQYIIPDISVDSSEESLRISIRGASEQLLQLNHEYVELLKQQEGLDINTKEYLNSEFQKAMNLINSLNLRHRAMIRIIHFLVQHQNDFFRQGPLAIRPLKMQELADSTGLHVSTVSRCVNNKYISTKWGTYSLRFFFSSGLATDAGTNVSSSVLKQKIQKMIDHEDAAHPLSDQDITNAFCAEGIQISRRTVAKYRKQSGIPTTNLRKRCNYEYAKS